MVLPGSGAPTADCRPTDKDGAPLANEATGFLQRQAILSIAVKHRRSRELYILRAVDQHTIQIEYYIHTAA
jgi:hypothetical protein